MTMNWIKSDLLDFSWVCGSLDTTIAGENDVSGGSNDQPLANVWSELEYEPSWENASVNSDGHSKSSALNYDEALRQSHLEAFEGRSVRSSLDPRQRSSNMPILRELPSFGSTLASRTASSLSSVKFGSRRDGSSDSCSQRTRFFTKPLDESPIRVKSNMPLPNSSNSYIFMHH
eukprot:Nitzschia sp. Nitz4//scaffold329_size19327//16679//17200//NITZ4_008730-RA/size19327-processed-gene-0.10-mRNA-1//1//CDS//3329548002//7655//frame0